MGSKWATQMGSILTNGLDMNINGFISMGSECVNTNGATVI